MLSIDAKVQAAIGLAGPALLPSSGFSSPYDKYEKNDEDHARQWAEDLKIGRNKHGFADQLHMLGIGLEDHAECTNTLSPPSYSPALL